MIPRVPMEGGNPNSDANDGNRRIEGYGFLTPLRAEVAKADKNFKG